MKRILRRFFYRIIPHSPKMRNGIELLKSNQFGLAEKEFIKAYKKNKDIKNLIYALSANASFHNVSASIDETMRLCKEISNECSMDRAFWNFYGRCWLDVAEKEFCDNEAGECFTKAIELGKGKCADDWYGLGMVRQYQGRYADAVDCYLNAIECDSSNVESKFRLWSLHKEGLVDSDFGIRPLKDNGDFLMEFDFDDIEKASSSQISMARKIKQFGTVVFRNVLRDKEFLASLRSEVSVFTEEYNYVSSLIAKYDDAPDSLKAKVEILINGEIFTKLLPLVSEYSEKGWQPFRNPSWWFQYMPVNGNFKNNQNEKLTSKTPLGSLSSRPMGYATPMHQDHPVNCQFSDWQTFWMTLDSCGEGVAPTLRVLTVPLRSAIDSFEEGLGRINSVKASLISEYFDGAMAKINANPGDIVVFGRFMLHQTYYDLGMKNSRTSVDLRWVVGPSVPKVLIN